MVESTLSGLSFAKFASIGILALALAGTAAAQASRVGVTSATDGDPLGKPPTDAERVLRIGIDVQANEVVTTHDDDRAHLVFLDGSSLTVGPNAQLKIDKFIYDPNTKTGELAITASKGLFRLVGGKISKTNAINIATPSGTIGIRGGITIFNVASGSTTASFIFRHNMTVTGQGQPQNVTRPGSQVIVNSGAPPGLPNLVPPGGLTAAIKQPERGNTVSCSSGNIDQKTRTSDFPARTPSAAAGDQSTERQQQLPYDGHHQQRRGQQPAEQHHGRYEHLHAGRYEHLHAGRYEHLHTTSPAKHMPSGLAHAPRFWRQLETSRRRSRTTRPLSWATGRGELAVMTDAATGITAPVCYSRPAPSGESSQPHRLQVLPLVDVAHGPTEIPLFGS